MDFISYLESIEGLRAVDRTVSAQAVSATDNGQLKYPAFFPVEDVSTTKLGELTIDTYRPVASRREWNGPDRLIPLRRPGTTDLEMVPIGDYFTVGEKELQSLEERTDGEEALILRAIGADVEGRTDGLAEAAYRRVEVDGHRLWATGKVVQDDPVTGLTVETNFNYGATRIQDASATPWTNVNFYANLIAWALEGKSAIGGAVEGVVLSQAKASLIKASGPKINGKELKYSELQEEIADALSVSSFRIVVNEDTLDFPVDGGTEFVPQRVWPINSLSLIPANGRVGRTVRAPVAASGALARAYPQARIDRRGVAIVYLPLNDGKGMKVRGQLHSMAIPAKGRVWSINVG